MDASRKHKTEPFEAEFGELISLFKASAPLSTRPGFSDRVMALLDSGQAADKKVWGLFSSKYGLRPNRNIATTGLGAFPRDTSILLGLTGFAHLLLAVVLYFGLRNMTDELEFIKWIKLQPFILSAMGSSLFVGAVFLWFDGLPGKLGAGAAVFIYFGIALADASWPIATSGLNIGVVLFLGVILGSMVWAGLAASNVGRAKRRP